MLGRAPDAFAARGLDAVTAGQYAHWLVVAILVPCALIMLRGLKGGTMVRLDERPPVRDLMIGGFRAARNPRIALAYTSAFVSRSEVVVIGTFTVLWAAVAGVDQGLTPADAVKRGAVLMVVANGAAMLWMPVIGLLIDRIDRTTALITGSAIGAVAFLGIGMVDDPLSREALPWFAMLGVGQTSCFLASQALIGQEADIRERGAVIGMFGICGAIGILVATSVGGQLFDAWMRAAPFVLIGIGNAAVFVLAAIVRVVAPR